MLSREFPGTPYGDCCRTCNDSVPYSPAGVLVWSNTGGRFSYVCAKGHTWACGFSNDPIWNAVLLQRDRRRFRVLGQSLPDDDSEVKRLAAHARQRPQRLLATAFHTLAEAAHVLERKHGASSAALQAVNAALDVLHPVVDAAVYCDREVDYQQ